MASSRSLQYSLFPIFYVREKGTCKSDSSTWMTQNGYIVDCMRIRPEVYIRYNFFVCNFVYSINQFISGEKQTQTAISNKSIWRNDGDRNRLILQIKLNNVNRARLKHWISIFNWMNLVRETILLSLGNIGPWHLSHSDALGKCFFIFENGTCSSCRSNNVQIH